MRQRAQLGVVFFWVVPVALFAYFSVVAPWAAAEAALASLEPRFNLVVAMGYEGFGTGQGKRTQAYLSFPASLRTLDTYTVIAEAAGTRVETVRFGAIIFAGLYGTWSAASFWYLFNRHRLSLAGDDDP